MTPVRVARLAPLSLAAASALVLAGPAVAGDLFVGPAGSGAPFEEIADALAVASPGDTIHVAPGDYDVFTIDLPVRVVGAGAESVVVRDSDGGPPLEIRSIPAGSEAVLSGMTVLTPVISFLQVLPVIRLEDNAGGVVLHDLEVRAVPGQFAPHLVQVLTSDRVVVDRCTLTAPDATGFSALGSTPLLVENSQAWISGSTLTAGKNADGTSVLDALAGVPALDVALSDVHVAASSLRGGHAGSAFVGSTEVGGAGGAGVLCRLGNAYLSGGPGNVARGGDASTVPGIFTPASPGLGVSGVGNLDYAQGVVFEGGLDATGVPGPGLVDDPFLFVTEQPFERPTLTASAAQVAVGGNLDLTHTGNPSATALVLFSAATGPALDVPGVDGPLVLDLTALFTAAGFALDGDGLGSATLNVPAQPALSGLTVVFQSFESSSTVQALSNPAVVAIEP